MRIRIVIAMMLLASGCSEVEDPSLHPMFKESKVIAPASMPATTYSQDRNLYFGDLHIHTGLSTDAYVMGVRSTPDDAYRYSTGHAIAHAAGYVLQIDRPLDFAAVTDHSEYLGHARLANLDIPTTRRPLRDLLLNGNATSITAAWTKTTLNFRDEGWGYGADSVDPLVLKSAWQETIAAAEYHNKPNVFTAFIGYEWSASVGGIATHIHRNVIYKGSDVSSVPFSSLDSNRAEDLWQFLQDEEEQGRAALAISHNANLSKGKMYPLVDSDGNALSTSYAKMRNYFEPISEILQIKGASETHPILSNLDEFADFAIATMVPGTEPEPSELPGSYARQALKSGIEFEAQKGFNPYRFGVIGASDSHNASSPADESNYSGKLPIMDGSAGLRTSEALLLPSKYNPASSWASGGLTAVWSEENTRESIFNALRRKETFATSGPRLSLRMFAGVELDESLLADPEMVSKAYQYGVPMGGELKLENLVTDEPKFLILAAKDPNGANLDRLQVVKGWVDSEGGSHEKIYNIAASGDREIDDETNELQAVGNSVDINMASYTNDIGTAQFSVLWVDPSFDASQHAFYYARVLQIPTPRWSTYDAVLLGSKPLDPTTIQERAIGSAIWYSPVQGSAFE